MRRAVVAAATVVVLATVLAAVGAERDVPVDDLPTIGVLRRVASTDQSAVNFEEALARAGFVPGRHVRILNGDAQEVQTDPDEVRALLTAWERQGVDLLVTLATEWSAIALEETDLPVVFVASAPASAGLLDHPRATGVAFGASSERTLDTLKLILPDADQVGFLIASADEVTAETGQRLRSAAEQLGLRHVEASFTDETDVEDAVRSLVERGADAVVVAQAAAAIAVQDTIIRVTQALGVPLVSHTRVIAPTLLAVYPDFDVVSAQVGRQAALVLGGLAPAEIPVEEPRRHGVRVDRARARDLGVGLPPSVLRIATEVVG